MIREQLGTLSRRDPMYELLSRVLLGGQGGDCGDFEVFRFGREGAVYLYVHTQTRARAIGKFYGRKWIPGQSASGEDLRSLLLQREFENMLMLRDRGFDGGPHVVPRPLETSEAVDWVLVEEFVEGENIHQILRRTLEWNDGELVHGLETIAQLLARLHRFTPPPTLLPRKDVGRYYDKVVTQLRNGEVISAADAERLGAIGRAWIASGILDNFTPAMIHGDATPEHFLHDRGAGRMHLIDVETLRAGDPAEDLGYLAGELKHLCWTYTRDRWSSEPAIRHLYAAYARAAEMSQRDADRLTERARYFMGCAELRIARNAWLPFDHRLELAAEAEQCLRI